METLGREVSALTERVRHIETEQERQTRMILEIRDFMVATRGSWKTIMAISGASAAVGALGIKVAALVLPGFPK